MYLYVGRVGVVKAVVLGVVYAVGCVLPGRQVAYAIGFSGRVRISIYRWILYFLTGIEHYVRMRANTPNQSRI